MRQRQASKAERVRCGVNQVIQPLAGGAVAWSDLSMDRLHFCSEKCMTIPGILFLYFVSLFLMLEPLQHKGLEGAILTKTPLRLTFSPLS